MCVQDIHWYRSSHFIDILQRFCVHIKFYLPQYKFINVAIINKLAVEADYVCIRRDSLDF